MALEIIKNINVDFYDRKYQLINAKQYDDCSRYISITCYNQGKFYNISNNNHSAYVRYRKADGYGVLNSCSIDYRGDVLVELTEQMLAASGVCYVDLIIVNKGKAVVNINTGEIVTIDDSPIMSTMAFCIDVQEASFDNSLVESSYEYDALNTLLKESKAKFEDIIRLSRSYATGDGDGIRENEEIDNSKYYSEQSAYSAGESKSYSEQASDSADAAKTSEQNAEEYKNNAKASEDKALASEQAAKSSEDKSLVSEQAAKSSEDKALVSEQAAKASEQAASASEQAAKASEQAASASEQAAKASEQKASTSEANAKASETNAYNYCETVKSVVDGLNSGFIPMGTISFSGLATAEKATGFTYNINEDFVTDESFREGAGKTYTAGTNVYYTADNYWDCFGGSASPTATVDEVKEYLGI